MTEFLVFGLTIAIAAVLLKSRWNYHRLPRLIGTAAKNTPDVTVIIPARNEAHQVRRAIESFRNVPVMVVDDDSTDDTAEIAAAAGATVIQATRLPPGWRGKPHACFTGASRSTTRWLLFVDADTWFEASFAALIVEYAEQNCLQLVSAFLSQEGATPFEFILLPYAFALYFTGVSARNLIDPKSSECLANGQCLLFERSAYEQIGGHSAVQGSVVEDVALSRVAKARGLRGAVVRAEEQGHVRMYEDFASIWRGFQKNSFRFLLLNPASGVQIVVASILLTSWLPVLWLAWRDVPPSAHLSHALQSPALLLFLCPILMLLPWYRPLRGVRILYSVFSPLAIYLFQLIVLNAMFTTLFRRGTIWKGRRI